MYVRVHSARRVHRARAPYGAPSKLGHPGLAKKAGLGLLPSAFAGASCASTQLAKAPLTLPALAAPGGDPRAARIVRAEAKDKAEQERKSNSAGDCRRLLCFCAQERAALHGAP